VNGNCGAINPPESLHCSCGYDFSNTAPPTYFVPALFTLLLFVPIGIVALIFSTQVRPKFLSGDLAGARRSSKRAAAMCVIGMILFIVLFLLGLLEHRLNITSRQFFR
jgi:Interferon-induced transmembrane protein